MFASLYLSTNVDKPVDNPVDIVLFEVDKNNVGKSGAN